MLDKHTTGDGIVSALQVLQAVRASGRSLAHLLEAVALFPQVLLNVRVAEGSDWRTNSALAAEQRSVEQQLGTSGRVLIHPSGTEPVLRVMVEAPDSAQARACAERLAEAARAVA